MQFTDVFIRRPVLAICVSLLILLIGLAAYFKLTVREFPKISASVITVNTFYAGADAKLVQGFVTAPIEAALSGLDGVDFIKSSSSQSMSSVSVFMNLGYDIDTAMTDVSSKVSSIRRKLPKDIDDPVVSKNDPNASNTMIITFMGDGVTPEQITDYLVRVVQPELQTLEGVGEAQIWGKREYAMRIWLDAKQMAAHNVTATDVKQALLANNIQAPAGSVKTALRQFEVNTTTDISTPEQFNNIVVRNEAGHVVRIKDIGSASLGAKSDDVSIIMSGKKAVLVAIIPKANANPIDVSKLVIAKFNELKQHLPAGIKAEILYDAAEDIQDSVKEVKKTIIEACLFVCIVILLMLGSLRAITIPIITIPLSLIGVCFIMLMFGYSINTLTLLAAVLAIGLVVDDAIVVLENIHRHIEEGLSPLEASLVGAREIRFAIITMTLTLAAVYAPIGFMGGLLGSLFSEFAFALAGAVIISGVIALTLSPMMCSKIYRDRASFHTGFANVVNNSFSLLERVYKFILEKVLKLRYVIVLITAIIYATCYLLFIHTPSELAPTEDRGFIMALTFGPTGANLQDTEQYTSRLPGIYQQIPEIKNYGIVNGFRGANSAVSFLILSPVEERERSAAEISRQLMPLFMTLTGVNVFPSLPPSLPVSGSTPVEFVLKTSDDYFKLNDAAQKFVQLLQQSGVVMNVRSDLSIDKPQTVIDIDRDRAADLGITMDKIADSLGIFLSQPTVTRFAMNGRAYDVIPQLYEQYRNSPNILNELEVRTASGKMVQLNNVVNIKEEVIPSSLNQFQQLHSATISAYLVPGVTQGVALNYLQQLAQKELPKSIQTDTIGQLRQFVQSSGQLLSIFVFSLLLIYLMLAAQFESFRDPFIVLLSVPLSFTGALAALYFTHGTLNIYTQIGLITLIGLITKNGILIVEFANQRQKQGMSVHEAIIDASICRLRPIVMTASTMILGALPLAFASGAGAESRQQLGWVIAGGIAFGTLMTLFVIPVAYQILAKKKENNV